MSVRKSFKEIDIENLSREPYRRILCYPSSDEREAGNRMRQLKTLGINSILIEGKTEISGFKILGKGCVSVVVKTKRDGRSLALKIRRLDANRVSMDHEVEMSLLANSIGIGPKVHDHTEDMILMDWVTGEDITTWFRSLKGPGSTLRLRKTLHGILKQCFEMDQLGLDHGQLSNL
ncbi:MAG: serine/threonine protein kinase, partial [Nitrososphaerales archaeon]